MTVGRGLRGLLVLAASLLPAAAARAANHPFGSHPMAYAAGSILPNNVTQTAMDQAVTDFYDQWKARFLKQTCGTGRYVVLTNVNRGNLTVSEGHGYGMIIAALMAGHDPDAHAIFDGMYAYFREHPTATHSYLMAWNQNGSCGNVQGQDSATDGDLDVAYALLLADKQWGSCGPVNYLAEAENVIADVKSGDVDDTGSYTLLGDWATPDDTQYYPSTRSSDFMLDHYRSFAAATGDPTWTNLLDQTYQLIQNMHANFSPSTGLLPDFVIDPRTSPQPAPANFLESANDGAYDYNACRDPWRIATDFLVSGDTRAHAAANAITNWIVAATGGDPNNIRSGYQLDGTPSPGTDYLSMAFVAPLGVGAMVDASHQAWLNSVWNLTVSTPVTVDAYYENTLKLLSMIVMSGNWWAPDHVAGGCTSSGTALCTDGGYMSDMRINLNGLTANPGRQSLVVKGKLFFPQGTPVSDFTGGAQLRVDDLGSGGSAVFDLTTDTTPIPPATVTGCDATRDVWKQTSQTAVYHNVSGELDPPVCTAGSAEGLRVLRYRTRTARDFAFVARGARSTISAPVGPLQATLVLGNTTGAGSAGECGISGSVPCTPTRSGMRCRQ